MLGYFFNPGNNIASPLVSRSIGGLGPSIYLVTAADKIFESSTSHSKVSIMLDDAVKVAFALS